MVLQHIKDYYFNICLSVIYTALASMVYGIWSYSAWQLWYVTFIIVFVIFVAGGCISVLWIRSEIRANEVVEQVTPEEIIVQ